MSVLDYLPIATPDYDDETLVLSPQDVVEMLGNFNQDIYPISNDQAVFPKSEEIEMYLVYKFDLISTEDRAAYIGFYFDIGKACGIARKIKLLNPFDGNVYVVRFCDKFNESLYSSLDVALSLTFFLCGRVES